MGFPNYFRAGYLTDGPAHVTSASSRLYATGLLVVDTSGRQWITISTDILALSDAVTNQIRTAAQTSYGIPPERVMLTATHTHSGPVLVDQPNLFTTYNIPAGSADENLVKSYSNAFAGKLTGLISTLVSAPREPVTATAAYGLANQAFNRAGSRSSLSEANLAVLTYRSAVTNKIVAVEFSYAMHATSLGPVNTWDGDYPRATADVIEQQLAAANPGARALYIGGAGGDQNPSPSSPSAIASALAPQVVSAANGAAGTGSIPVGEPQTANHQAISLPLDIRVSDATLRARYAATAVNAPEPDNRRHAQLMVGQIDSGTLRRAMSVELTVWLFSAPAGTKPLAWIGIAGEPTIDYSTGFQRIVGDQYRPWTVGYANGHPGYLPSDEELARGDGCPASNCFYRDYEAGWATVENGQRYPNESSIVYNDGLAAPLAAGADNAICRSATTLLLGTASNCAAFTPGRLIPHPALVNTGSSLSQWTDAAGRSHVELLALGTDTCLHHRSWTGDSNGGVTGTWSAWDPANMCGGIATSASSNAWVDPSGNAHIEMVVRTGNGSVFHGRCTGDATGCFDQTWQWTQIATPSNGFTGTPELALWKQQDGTLRLDAYAVTTSGGCLYHRGWIGSDAFGNGSWGGWSSQPGCGGIVTSAGAESWRDSGGTMRHDVLVVTTNGSVFTIRCSGSDASCSWGSWTQLSAPTGTTAASYPAFAATSTPSGPRFDLYVRGRNNCIMQAAWSSATVPTAPAWRTLAGCGLAASPAAVDWSDSFGRARSTVSALDAGTRGPLWIRDVYSPSGPASDIVSNWNDIADPTASIAAP